MERNRAFTLVEVLVAATILGVGVAAVMGGLGALNKAEAAVYDRDTVSLLANEKLNELVATQEYREQSGGSFDDDRYQNFTWTVEELPTTVEGVSAIRLTVTNSSLRETTVERLVFTPTGQNQNNNQGGGNN